MEKIKVLMIGNHHSVRGGITSVIQQLLAFDWQTVGVEMQFVPTYIEGSFIRKSIFFTKAYMNIRKIIRTDKPDVVHIHMSYKGSFYRKNAIHRLCKSHGIPDIIHLHGSKFQNWYNEADDRQKFKIRLLLKEVAAVIVLGEKWNEIISDIEAKARIIVVSNAVHIPDRRAEWRDNPFTLLFLGVLIKRKGVADLIQAISKLRKQYKLAHIRLVIAGSGEEEESLRALTSKLELEPWIEFAGWICGKEKEKYLRESQVLVLPSYNEGLPVAVLEAMSFGLPVIATDVGDMSTAVKDCENGFIIEAGDIKALADSIFKISANKEQYMQMSARSREIACEKFSDSNFFEEILSCYRDAKCKK